MPALFNSLVLPPPPLPFPYTSPCFYLPPLPFPRQASLSIYTVHHLLGACFRLGHALDAVEGGGDEFEGEISHCPKRFLAAGVTDR